MSGDHTSRPCPHPSTRADSISSPLGRTAIVRSHAAPSGSAAYHSTMKPPPYAWKVALRALPIAYSTAYGSGPFPYGSVLGSGGTSAGTRYGSPPDPPATQPPS